MAGLRRLGLPRREVAGRVERARQALERGGSLNERHVASMAAALVGCGEARAAEGLVLSSGAAGSHAFSIVQGALVQRGRYERALRLMEKMREAGVRPDRVNYNVLLGARLPAATVRCLLGEMERQGVAPDERTYAGAINALARRRGGFGAAQELWDDMQARGVAPTPYTWCALVSAAAEEGDPALARALVEEMAGSGQAPTIAVHNAALKAFARRRDAPGAIAALERLRHAGIAPNTATFNVAMEACCRAGSPESLGHVKALYGEILAEGLEPTDRTFGVLLRAAGHRRDLPWLTQVLADLEARGLSFNQPLYDHVVHAFVRCGQGSLALGYLERMVAAGFAPALGVSEVLVRSGEAAMLRECLAAHSQAGGLTTLLQDMQRSGVQLTSATGARVCREVLRREGAGAALGVVETMHAAAALGMLCHGAGRALLVKVLSRAADEDPTAAARAAKWLLPALERASLGAPGAEEGEGAQAGRGAGANQEPPSETILSAATEAGNFALANEALRMRAVECQSGGGRSSARPDEVLLETVDSALRRAFSDSIRREAGLQDFHASGIKPKAGELEAAVRSVLREGDNKVGGAGGANRAAPGEAPSPALLPRPSRQAALERRVRRTRADCAEVGAGNVPQQRRVALRRAVELVELGPEYFDWEVGSWVYQQLMDALVRAGEFETAVAVWEKCRREKPEVVDVKSWTVYIRALAGLNRCTGRAVAILADVRSDGVIPDKTMLKTLQTVLKSQRDEQGVLLVGEQLDALGE